MLALAAVHVIGADVAASDAVEKSASLQYGAVSYASPLIPTPYGELGLAGRLGLPIGVAAMAGARLGFGDALVGHVAVEGFVSLALEPRMRVLRDDEGRTGAWRPLAGVELGFSTVKRAIPSNAGPGFERDVTLPGPIYLAFPAQPFRFRVNQFMMNVLGLTVGTTLDHPGKILRLQLNVAEIGWIF